MKTDFSPSNQVGVYNYDKNNNVCKLTVQISSPMPIEILGLIGDYADLQYYAESFIETLLQAECISQEPQENKEDFEEEEENDLPLEDDENKEKDDEDYEGKDKVNDFWIIASNLYKKRENLSTDQAEWTGWEV